MVITAEQENQRRHYIGASEIAAIVGLSPYENAAGVYAMKVLGATRRKTAAMQNGLDYEPFLLEYGASQIEKRLGLSVTAVEENSEFSLDGEGDPPIVCHLDGLVHLEDGTQAVLEAKTTRLIEQYGKPWTDEIPPSVLCQVMAQMALSKVSKAFVVVMTTQATIQMHELDFDEDIWESIKEKCREFWFDYVVKEVQPTGEVSLELMERIDRYEEDSVLELEGDEGAEFVTAVVEWEQAKALALQAKKEVEATKASILKQMKSYSVVRAGKVTAHFPREGRKVLKARWK